MASAAKAIKEDDCEIRSPVSGTADLRDAGHVCVSAMLGHAIDHLYSSYRLKLYDGERMFCVHVWVCVAGAYQYATPGVVDIYINDRRVCPSTVRLQSSVTSDEPRSVSKESHTDVIPTSRL
jgi:hypothetical protein